MEKKKTIFWIFLLLILAASLYRIFPGRPLGFAPQIAMALFAGAVIKDKRWALTIPLVSMLISDLLYELLFVNGLSDMPGFYAGQITNYILLAGITLLGSLMKRLTVLSVLSFSLIAPTIYFVLSNLATWLAGAGYQRPQTFSGMLQALVDGIPFYRGSLLATLIFSTLFFGGYVLVTRRKKWAVTA